MHRRRAEHILGDTRDGSARPPPPLTYTAAAMAVLTVEPGGDVGSNPQTSFYGRGEARLESHRGRATGRERSSTRDPRSKLGERAGESARQERPTIERERTEGSTSYARAACCGAHWNGRSPSMQHRYGTSKIRSALTTTGGVSTRAIAHETIFYYIYTVSKQRPIRVRETRKLETSPAGARARAFFGSGTLHLPLPRLLQTSPSDPSSDKPGERTHWRTAPAIASD